MRSAAGDVRGRWRSAATLYRSSCVPQCSPGPRRGCELLEVAILTHREGLLTLTRPKYYSELWQADGFLHHANSPFWQTETERSAHADILRAMQWSQYALLAAAAGCDRKIDTMSQVSVTNPMLHTVRVLSYTLQHQDEQAEDIVLRTAMPQGYVYFFVCMLVYYRLVCGKQLELLE